MGHIEEIEEHLETLSELVRRNVRIVSQEEDPTKRLLHVSTDGYIKGFIPKLPSRAMEDEDKTVPRACASPSILACFIGYTKALSTDFYLPSNASSDEKYKGGWVIYEIPFKACLRPTKALVPDVERSDEHWLISYTKETAVMKPAIQGKAFIRRAIFTPVSGDYPRADVELYVEVIDESGLPFSKNIYLEKGYYSISGPDFQSVEDWTDDSYYTVEVIDKQEYGQAKRESANLLSATVEIPTYLNW